MVFITIWRIFLLLFCFGGRGLPFSARAPPSFEVYSMKLKIQEVIMSRYKDSNKYKIYGEDAILAARFDKYLDATLRNCRADYLKALSKRKQREIPYEDLPDAEKETVQESSAADDEIESLLFWEALKTHLHLLNPKECEVMIGLYVKRFSAKKIAAQMGVEPATVTYYKKCAINKIRDEVMEDY
jgi:RNA polymerase sigma factor (sigma-70 family)